METLALNTIYGSEGCWSLFNSIHTHIHCSHIALHKFPPIVTYSLHSITYLLFAYRDTILRNRWW